MKSAVANIAASVKIVWCRVVRK